MSLFFKIWRDHFTHVRRAKICQAFTPFEGEWYEYTIFSSEMLKGKGFFWYLLCHIAFCFREAWRSWRSTSTPSLSQGFLDLVDSGKWFIWVYCRSYQKKVKPYFPRKGIYLSFLWKKWLYFWALEGEFLFEKLAIIVAFYCGSLNIGTVFIRL